LAQKPGEGVHVNNHPERSSATAAPLDDVKQSVHSDLQYVSLQVEGKTYGGWYRLLPDGQMELLALANMHSERRDKGTPIEQARGMLADFVRSARSKLTSNGSAAVEAESSLKGAPKDSEQDAAARTLGDLLYADPARARVPEEDWARLVQCIATGDQLALYRLFERTHRIVFTSIMRMTNSRETAEDLTLDVFHDIWREASNYDAAKESVVGWIMNQARCKAIDEVRQQRFHPTGSVPADAASDFRETSVPAEPGTLVPNALVVLSPAERQMIEALFFSELGYDELAAEPETVRNLIHSGLEKLRQALTTGVKEQ
jgi:RNA polymerase sigma-70 factor (ECF subfamily)